MTGGRSATVADLLGLASPSDRYPMDRSLMHIELHGTGRAAGALGLAAVRAGHRVTAVRGRTAQAVAQMEDLLEVRSGSPTLRILAVADDAIADVAGALVDEPAVDTVHVSGSVGVAALDALCRADGPQVGSFHPLQTLPSAEAGAARLPGSWVAITADEPFAATLEEFAASLGCHSLRLADDAKSTYHAAAAASANFPLVALGIAERLYAEAGVPFEAARPLIEAVVANAFDLGPAAALTGPIARGDVGTVERQLAAVAEASPGLERAFRDMARATAAYADAPADVRRVIG